MRKTKCILYVFWYVHRLVLLFILFFWILYISVVFYTHTSQSFLTFVFKSTAVSLKMCHDITADKLESQKVLEWDVLIVHCDRIDRICW